MSEKIIEVSDTSSATTPSAPAPGPAAEQAELSAAAPANSKQRTRADCIRKTTLRTIVYSSVAAKWALSAPLQAALSLRLVEAARNYRAFAGMKSLIAYNTSLFRPRASGKRPPRRPTPPHPHAHEAGPLSRPLAHAEPSTFSWLPRTPAAVLRRQRPPPERARR